MGEVTVKVYDALALAFAREGTTDVFGMMGDANMHWINAMVGHGVRVYNARHEGGALGMADGWARATGQPGIATTTCGPGVTQLSTTVIVASRARTPIVAFCGETAVGDDDDTQFLNVERYAAAVECGFVRVAKPEMAFDAVQRAFYLARSQSRPVILSAPEDVQRCEFDDEQTYVPAMRLIGDSRLAPSPADVEKAAKLIGASERVVVVVGDGARRAAVGDLVLELHELTHALVATTLRAKNWLRQETDFHAGISGLFATKSAIELLQQADCVIAIGASMNWYTIEHGYLYPAAKYVHIDVRPHLTMGNGALADCYIQAEARLALVELNRALRSRPAIGAGYHTALVRDSLAAALRDPEKFDAEPGAVDPRDACRVIDEELGGDVGLVLGSSYQSGFGAFLLSKPRRDVVVNYGYFGAIGQALILGIGAVVGSGYRPMVVVDGDASFMMYLSEFETACRYRMPLLVVVFNDQALGAESHKSALYGLDPELTFIRTPDLGQVAASLGGRGALVREPEELRAALREFTDSPAPTVIDLRVARNVLSITDRRLHFGADV
jgi:thiamine pyrophosphate-dependent acetolactate synthase large subunit-like protein